MIDHSLGFTSPQRKNAYYFQFYPNTVKLKRGQRLQLLTIKFAVTKDNQILSKSRSPIELNFSRVSDVLPLKKCYLNFYVGDISMANKSIYGIKVFIMNQGEEIESGQVQINVSEFVSSFNKEKKFSFQSAKELGNFFVDFDIFIEKSRASLDRMVREVKQEVQQKEKQAQPTEISYPSSRRKYNSQAPSETSDLSKSKRFQRVRNESSYSNRFKKPINENIIQKEEPRYVRNRMSTEQKVEVHEKNNPKSLNSESASRKGSQGRWNDRNAQQCQQISSPRPAIAGIQRLTYKRQRKSNEVSQKINKSIKQKQKQQETKNLPQQANFYNIKMIVFLVFSLFLMYQVMLPTRKAPYKKVQ